MYLGGILAYVTHCLCSHLHSLKTNWPYIYYYYFNQLQGVTQGSAVPVISRQNELRLPKQNWNNLVNLPRQNFVTFSYYNNRLFSSYRGRYQFTEVEFKDPRQSTEAEFWHMLHIVTVLKKHTCNNRSWYNLQSARMLETKFRYSILLTRSCGRSFIWEVANASLSHTDRLTNMDSPLSPMAQNRIRCKFHPKYFF